MKCKISKISYKDLSVLFLEIILICIPFIPMLTNIFSPVGWIKDIMCVFICMCVLIYGKFRINVNTVGVIVYTIFVLGSMLISNDISVSTKIDAFRYRCEYAITFALMFNSIRFSASEIKKIYDSVLKILYYTGLVVAFIGVIEIVMPSPIHALYGKGLTTHLSLNFGGTLGSRLISTMANPINLGMQMVLACAAALYLFYKDESNMKRTKRIAIFCSIMLFALITILTYSRTAYLMFGLTFGVFYFTRVMLSKTKNTKKMFAVVMLIIFISVFIVLLGSNETFAIRLGQMNVNSFFNNSRFKRAYEGFATSNGNIFNYLFGFGIGKILSSTGQHVLEFGYASLLFESGIIGSLIFAIIIFKAIRMGIRTIKSSLDEGMVCSILLSILASFCGGMLASDVYFQAPYNLFFWLTVFLLKCIYEMERGRM